MIEIANLIKFNLDKNNQIGISFLAFLLIFVGLYFFMKTGFLSVKFLPEVAAQITENLKTKNKNAISALQTLIVSTASRVGIRNSIGVASAISLLRNGF